MLQYSTFNFETNIYVSSNPVILGLEAILEDQPIHLSVLPILIVQAASLPIRAPD